MDSFGHSLRSSFCFEDGYVNLNHGSYGSTPKIVLERLQSYRSQMEAVPDRWFRKAMCEELDLSRAAVAEYVGADANDLVFVDNASHGMNSIFRSLLRSPSDKVLYLSLAYQMVKNALHYMHDTFGVGLVEVPIEFPTSSDAIVAAIERAMDANPGITLAVIDHITSCPALLLPIDRIVKLCKSRGCMIAIDGAHAVGQVKLDLNDLGADFYVSNCNKWLYTPKTCALLWVKPEHQTRIFPATISNLGKGKTPFIQQFSYQGTSDICPYLAVRAALKFRSSLGDDAIMMYMRILASRAADLLVRKWNTETLVDGDLSDIAMVNVRLPFIPNAKAVYGPMPDVLLERFHTWVPVFEFKAGSGVYFVRVSAQIFLDLSDFDMVADAVLSIIKEHAA